jgi:hypothetical protein
VATKGSPQLVTDWSTIVHKGSPIEFTRGSRLEFARYSLLKVTRGSAHESQTRESTLFMV